MTKARAFAYAVIEKYGFVWVCIGEAAGPVPVFPEWEDSSYMKVHSGPYPFSANGFRAIENFLDVSHFPFVHGNMNGLFAKPDKLNGYSVEATDAGLKTTEIGVFQPFGDARGVPILSNYTFSCFRPLVAHFNKRIQDVGPDGNVLREKETHFATLCTAQLVDETHCVLRICGALDVQPAPPLDSVRQRADVIFGQDREIVETQRPERIPTELRMELHHRSDLLGQRYRTWLRSLGITYGVV